MAKLSKSEMSALDLLIAKRQEDAGFACDIIMMAKIDVADAVDVVTAVAGGRVEAAAQQGEAGAGSSLDRLLKLRAQAQSE